MVKFEFAAANHTRPHMETKLILTRKCPAAIADLIISFISPLYAKKSQRSYPIECAMNGFYENSHPFESGYVRRHRMWETILAAACEYGHINIAQRAVRAGARDFGAALSFAATGPDMSVLMWTLMKHLSAIMPNPDPDIRHRYEYIGSALTWAIRARNYEAARILAHICPVQCRPGILWQRHMGTGAAPFFFAPRGNGKK
jgi:hypothetical protein